MPPGCSKHNWDKTWRLKNKKKIKTVSIWSTSSTFQMNWILQGFMDQNNFYIGTKLISHIFQLNGINLLDLTSSFVWWNHMSILLNLRNLVLCMQINTFKRAQYFEQSTQMVISKGSTVNQGLISCSTRNPIQKQCVHQRTIQTFPFQNYLLLCTPV